MNLETGQVQEEAFTLENDLYIKARAKKLLDAEIRSCTLCKGLNIKRMTEGCPGWGNLNADVFIIGQSLHAPGMETDIPFILASGYLIDAALHLSGMLRKDVFLTNAVHCHPARNRGSLDDEKKNCLPFLAAEIAIVQPKLLCALGADAQQAVSMLKSDVSRKVKKQTNIFKVADIKTVNLKHPAALFKGAPPEELIEWVIKLSNEIDKVVA